MLEVETFAPFQAAVLGEGGATNNQRGEPLWTPPESRASESRAPEVNDMGAPPPEIRRSSSNSSGRA
jgi:hypothetical protein